MRLVIISFFRFSFSIFSFPLARSVSFSFSYCTSTTFYARSVAPVAISGSFVHHRGKEKRGGRIRSEIGREKRNNLRSCSVLPFTRDRLTVGTFFVCSQKRDGRTNGETTNGWPDSADRTRDAHRASNRWGEKKSDTGTAAEGANPYAHCQQ